MPSRPPRSSPPTGARIGIDVKLSLLEGQLWTNKVFKDRNYDVSMVSLTARTDPLFGVDRSFLCNTTNVPYVNPTGYCNPDLDAIAAKAAAVPLEERRQWYKQYEEIIARDMPHLTLTNAKKFFAISSRFGGIDEEMDLAFNGNPDMVERLGQDNEQSAIATWILSSNALIRPRTIAVIGASPKRQTLGNVALDNLANYKFAGRVIPVHAEAPEIAGLAAVSADRGAAGRCRRGAGLRAGGRRRRCRAPARSPRRADGDRQYRRLLGRAGGGAAAARGQQPHPDARPQLHGPDQPVRRHADLYRRHHLARPQGPVALIAQSGSAAISVINSCTAGFSKVVTIGSEYRVTGADYLHWFAGDDDTSVIGLVLESIPDADRFADAVDRVHAAGKSMVVLKVGRSATGARATLAHTGALIRNDDAFKGFVERYGIPVVDDYEELIATLEAFAVSRKRPTRGDVALMGISGGETALACDICDEIDLPLAVFSEATGAALRSALPGIPGQNPLDVGQSVGRQAGAALAGMTAVMTADEVGIGVVLQDMQASLPASSLRNYSGHLGTVAELSRAVDKPIIVISPTAEIMSDRLLGHLEGTGVPPLRGLWPGLVAVKSMVAWAGRRRDPRRLADRKLTPERAALRQEIAGIQWPAAVEAGRPSARELRDSGRQIRRGAFGGGGGGARRPDRLPDGREGDVRRRAAPLRRRRGPARHHGRGGPRARRWR